MELSPELLTPHHYSAAPPPHPASVKEPYCWGVNNNWSGLGIHIIFISGPVIPVNCWCGHLLKMDAKNCPISHFFIFVLFSGVHGKGRNLGLSGGSDLTGHPHTLSRCSTLQDSIAAPTRGKSFEITSNWISTV